MTPWAHHLASRWTAAFRTPISCYVGFASAFMLTSPSLPATAVGEWPDIRTRSIFAVTIFFTVFVTSAFVAVLGGGRTGGNAFPGFMGVSRGGIRDWPDAALPLAPGARALVEALAGVGAMAVWLAALAAFGPLASALGLDVDGSLPADVSRSAAWSVIVSAPMLVPCAMAALLPARSQVIGVLRAVAVAAVAAFVTTVGLLPLALGCAAGMAAALWATARVALIPGPIALPSRDAAGPGQLSRASRPPLAQLWRDACLRPLRVTRWMLVAAAACFGLAAALTRAGAGWEVAAVALVGMPPFLVAAVLAWCPLGTFPDRRGAVGPFADPNGSAWLELPLRREWVMRAFYAHGVVTGLVFVALTVLGRRITGGGVLLAPDVPAGWAGLLCGVPPFAGFLTCRATGDRLRGAISLACFLLVAFLVTDERLALAPLALLAAVGGVPPLVHLLDRRSR